MTDRDPTPIHATWAGETVYRCRMCDYDTTEEQKFVYHVANVHPPLEIIDGGKADDPDEPTPKRPAKGRGKA